MPADGGHKPYPFAGGLIYLDVEHSPMMRARAEGRYETAKTALIQQHLEPGMTFVDVGANMGDFSLIAAKVMGDRGCVLAFEPSPENCGWIRRSIALNGYRSIEVMETALSDTRGEDTLYLSDRVGRHSLLPREDEQETLTVAVDTLDSVLETSGDPHVDMVKIDVEGAELKVLRGARATLGAAGRMMLMVDVHGGRVDPLEVCALLAEHGFALRSPEDPARDLEPARDTREVLALKGY
jgi:FkbM family methyltransferase